MYVKKSNFEVSPIIENDYDRRLKNLADKVAVELSKAKSIREIERIKKRYGNNKKFLALAESTANKMIKATDKTSKRIWERYIDAQIKKQKRPKLNTSLKKLIDDINLDKQLDENTKLITSIPDVLADQAIKKIKELTKQNVTGATRASEMAKYLKEKGIKRADLIARTETGKANTAVTEARSQSLGIIAYIWKTSLDRRVRLEHRAMRNVICFFNSKPTPGQLPQAKYKNDRNVAPGEDFQCRCNPSPIIFESQLTEISRGGKVKMWLNNGIRSVGLAKAKQMLGFDIK